VVAGLIVTTAACGRSGPEEEKKAPAETAAPAPTTSGPLTVEWTDSDLENHASRVGYGSAPKSTVARGKDGALIFTPQTPQDHLATNFIPLPAYAGDRSLDLSVQAQSPGGETCAANLQDQGFNILASVPCKAAGEQHMTVKVPRTVTGVRVYFISGTRAPIHLPVHMRLSEQR
jgi:hypothetical protein